MDREQGSNDDVTGHVCYDSSFIGLRCVGLMRSIEKGQNQQQPEDHLLGLSEVDRGADRRFVVSSPSQ